VATPAPAAGVAAGLRTNDAVTAAAVLTAAVHSQTWRNAVTAAADVAGVPRMVTNSATPSAEATCRPMLTRADPVPNRAAGSAVVLALISVGSVSPTPMPVSSMLGSRSSR
jgi:hypothetical protein